MAFSKSPNHVDLVVGQRLRWRRRELRLTQEQLGDRLGLTFQQVQNYEKGVNRIAAGRLFDIATELGVEVSYFFEGAAELIHQRARMVAEDDLSAMQTLPVIDAEAMELILAYQAISDPVLRKSLLNAIKAAAGTGDEVPAAKELMSDG
jgi:transcriptional regulator with XRE-family HTH domain